MAHNQIQTKSILTPRGSALKATLSLARSVHSHGSRRYQDHHQEQTIAMQIHLVTNPTSRYTTNPHTVTRKEQDQFRCAPGPCSTGDSVSSPRMGRKALSRRDIKLTTHIYLALKLMSTAISPLPQYAFVPWCLMKHMNKFILTFTLYRNVQM
jgi:hypothetical protein